MVSGEMNFYLKSILMRELDLMAWVSETILYTKVLTIS
jgi:hypothetical protein